MRSDKLLAGGLAVFFCFALVQGAGYRWQSGLGPILAGGVGLILAGSLFFGWHRGRREATTVYTRNDAVQFLWLFAGIGLVVLFGFALGGFSYVFAFIAVRRRDPRRWIVALFAALTVPVVVLGLFDWALGIPLFQGLLLR